MDVAICHFCDLTESCWEEVIKAHNEYFAMGGSIRIKGKVKEQVRRRNRAELQIMRQGGKCLGCYKEIGENFINTNGLILHEGCNLPEPGPVKARSVAPDKVVLIQ
jgi:hypothetical protein